jgi:hypothetical protein
MSQVECPRCSGSGIYRGFGVCYRCRGRKVVSATPKRAPRAALPAPTSPEELAERTGVSLADAQAAFAYDWSE